MKKRILCIMLCAICALVPLCSCDAPQEGEGGEKITVVTTVFPAYDWAKNLFGDRAEISLLSDNGVDMHSYNPTASDILRVKNCDMFIYVGGESDEWAQDIVGEGANPEMRVVRLFDAIGDSLLTDRAEPGMTAGDSDDGEEPDEHIWLSFENAKKCCTAIAGAFCAIVPEYASEAEKNLEGYIAKLDGLKAEYASALSAAKSGSIVVADRYPFRYLAHEFGLEFHAAFRGCSAESEASAKTISFLAEKLVSLDLPAVIVLENSETKLAETVVESSGRSETEILVLNSMQSVTAAQIEAGASYLDIARGNLQTLKKALSAE